MILHYNTKLISMQQKINTANFNVLIFIYSIQNFTLSLRARNYKFYQIFSANGCDFSFDMFQLKAIHVAFLVQRLFTLRSASHPRLDNHGQRRARSGSNITSKL